MSDKRSSDESRKPPKLVTRPERRATWPSSMSNRFATIRTMPAQKNLPKPNSMPEPTLIATPMKVRMFGLICPRANQRTIASMIRWPARPMLAPNIRYLLMLLTKIQSTGDHRNGFRRCQEGMGHNFKYIRSSNCEKAQAAQNDFRRFALAP